jgi:uncharacterized membrane protein YqaE (UPF0057 family)
MTPQPVTPVMQPVKPGPRISQQMPAEMTKETVGVLNETSNAQTSLVRTTVADAPVPTNEPVLSEQEKEANKKDLRFLGEIVLDLIIPPAGVLVSTTRDGQQAAVSEVALNAVFCFFLTPLTSIVHALWLTITGKQITNGCRNPQEGTVIAPSSAPASANPAGAGPPNEGSRLLETAKNK